MGSPPDRQTRRRMHDQDLESMRDTTQIPGRKLETEQNNTLTTAYFAPANGAFPVPTAISTKALAKSAL